MVGQLFDNIFVYLQNVTTKFDADNRLTYGVSKDLVADIQKGLLSHVLRQMRLAKHEAQKADLVVCVGDLFCLVLLN